MFTEAIGGLATAIDLYEKRNAIAQLLKTARHIMLNGNTRVGVFGAGGTGKTTLGNYLSGKLDTDKFVSEYEETLGIEYFRASGEIPALISVVPGQEHRRPATWKELYQELSSGRSFRVINVVAWGYHGSGLEKNKHRSFVEAMSDQEFRNAYLIDSREEEMRLFAELVPHLIATPGHLKLVSLVTKQDLWWDKRVEALSHYTSGAYQSAIDKIKSEKGVANFSHEMFSCALVEQNLRMADGFLVCPTSLGYDDPLRLANLERSAHGITQLMR